MKKEIIELGTFEVVSPVLRISDPCYDKKTWCAGAVKNVKTGTWKAQVLKVDEEDNWGNRPRKICAVHESFNKASFTKEKVKFTVGVDSGQAGIFDDKFYNIDYDEDYLQKGMCEYDQANDLYRADETIKMCEGMMQLEKQEPALAERLKNPDYFKLRLEEAKETLARGKNWDYSDAQPTRKWYDIASDVTFTDIGAGVIRNGVCSRSGYGDGSYSAYIAKDLSGKIVGVKILF